MDTRAQAQRTLVLLIANSSAVVATMVLLPAATLTEAPPLWAALVVVALAAMGTGLALLPAYARLGAGRDGEEAGPFRLQKAAWRVRLEMLRGLHAPGLARVAGWSPRWASAVIVLERLTALASACLLVGLAALAIGMATGGGPSASGR